MKMSILMILLFTVNLFAQVYTERDTEICTSIFSFSVDKNLSEEPVNNIITSVGKEFIGTDYEAFTLEKEGTEQLVINLRGLDCTTFLENALVFGRLIKSGKTSFEDYQKELTYIRYRDGKLDGYPSRLHYFSDWIYNNTAKGIVKDVTKEIGGESIRFNVGFMSSHPDSYRQLKSNPDFVSVIKGQEKEINSRDYFYIPKSKVVAIEKKIHNGDLLALTTNQKGLDIGHVGIAVKMEDGRIHFMHAPIVGSEVQISEQPLPDYLAAIKKHTGLIVLRPQEPVKQ